MTVCIWDLPRARAKRRVYGRLQRPVNAGPRRLRRCRPNLHRWLEPELSSIARGAREKGRGPPSASAAHYAIERRRDPASRLAEVSVASERARAILACICPGTRLRTKQEH